MIAIYSLTWNGVNFYVGKTNSIKTREARHMGDLKRGNHWNYKLQEAYSTYNTLPTFNVIEYCEDRDANMVESKYIAQYKSVSTGYNILGNENYFEEGPGASNKQIVKLDTEIDCKIIIIEPDLTVKYVNNLAAFCRETFPETCSTAQTEFSRIKRRVGNKKSYRGYLAVDPKLKLKELEVNIKDNYIVVVSPEGEEYTVTNIAKFCKEHPILKDNWSSAANTFRNIRNGGTSKSYRGFTIKKEHILK